MRNKARFGLLGVLTGVVLSMVGCGGPSYKARDVQVSLGESLQQGFIPSIEVDLIGASDDTRLAELRGMSVDSYFAPGNAARSNESKQTFFFAEDNTGMKTFAKSDPLWNEWKPFTHLVVVASLRGDFDGGGGDPRRWVIPLSSERWNSGDVIKIDVENSGLKLRSTMKPVKD